MQKLFKILVVPFLVLFLCAGTAIADNITIYDGAGYLADGQGGEVNETEEGMVNSLEWDLQAFLLEGNILSMGGGFNFLTGVSSYTTAPRDYTSGDIFLNTNGDGVYDYVIDVDWSTLTYDVFSLDINSTLIDVYLTQNILSNPWKYESGGTLLSGYEDLTFSSDSSGASGYSQFVTGFDLSFLGVDQDFIAHFTMGCGNDNLMGSTAPVPEPATMLLLGTGLIGLVGVGRKKLFKK
ncbi:PEP-CTERM sorting domain-containing protein [Thermodesulfobacteriota bacterium]